MTNKLCILAELFAFVENLQNNFKFFLVLAIATLLHHRVSEPSLVHQSTLLEVFHHLWWIKCMIWKNIKSSKRNNHMYRSRKLEVKHRLRIIYQHVESSYTGLSWPRCLCPTFYYIWCIVNMATISIITYLV